MAECHQIPIIKISDTPCSDMVMSNQVELGKEMNKSMNVNISKGKTIVARGNKVKVLKECRS
jgi:nicotinic acid phosphoribosyltransferase